MFKGDIKPFMKYKNAENSSFLDNIRIDKGKDDLINFFRQSSKNDIKKSLTLINDKLLEFPTLFILRQEIIDKNLFNSLNQKNKAALAITREILSDEKYAMASLSEHYKSLDYVNALHTVLKWIIESGFKEDGMNDEYDRIMDISSVVLIKTYKDKTVLPLIAEMLFERYRNGLLIHDMAWAFFEAANPASLGIIAEKLLSPDKNNAQAASKLLNFIPEMKKSSLPEEKYTAFLKWSEENAPFLKYTGESFQQTWNPEPYRIVLEGKYLCKRISCTTGKILSNLSEDEQNLIENFNKLATADKILLSGFSIKLHRRNIYLWRLWINCHLDKQLKIAGIGGIQ